MRELNQRQKARLLFSFAVLFLAGIAVAGRLCSEWSGRPQNPKRRASLMRELNQRQKARLLFSFAVLFLAGIAVAGRLCSEASLVTDFSRKNLAPCLAYPFGTDWLGRDMFLRTLTGLSTSILIGVCAAGVSAVTALVLGLAAATLGKKTDSVISFVIDMVMGIPHILLVLLISYACGKGMKGVIAGVALSHWCSLARLIRSEVLQLKMGIPHILLVLLISYACGKGMKGVIAGVALSHWCSLARLIRSEVLQLKQSEYILIAGKLGHSKFEIAKKHMLPHLLPQFVVGLVLLFPHAILHESSVTFLGFGLSSEQPAIGIILSESMKYLITGKWWLALSCDSS